MNSKLTADLGSSSPTHSGNYLGDSHKPPTSSYKKKGRSNFAGSIKTEQDLKPADYKILADEEDERLRKQREVNSKLNDDFKRRQARYLKREQEYRRHIEELQRELRIRLGYEVDAHSKNMKVIGALRDELHDNIDGIQDKIKNLKEEQEKDIVRKFNCFKEECKKNSKTTKGMSKEELKDRENQLNQHLEVITNIAQRIENENRTLMKKNSELKKEYQNQENDRELLLKQLVMLKKENGKIKEEIDFYNMIIEEKKEEEEQVDVDNSPPKSQMSNKGRTLLNSRKSSKRNNQASESLRQSSQRMKFGQSVKGDHMAAASFGPAVQETEEDKIHRYERIIKKLKKQLDFERKNLKGARSQYQNEMNHKTELEDMLKECVHQVQGEIQKRNKDQKTSALNFVQKKSKISSIDDIEFTEHDRERVIELLLSQEKVLHLLYEKTFPSEENPEGQEGAQEQEAYDHSKPMSGLGDIDIEEQM